jgi:glycosyltransferase involved in cell wall biosynthesis
MKALVMNYQLFGIAKRALRRSFGLWPLMEAKNRFTMGVSGLKFRLFENKEVARIFNSLDRVPTADIACIIPTYKRPQGLLNSIDSILAQDFQDFVIIVVDDGGGLTANLPDDPRIFAVNLARNTKVLGLVRNVGIRISNSNYVAFLDDDNTWTKEHLSEAVNALEDGADLIYTAVRRKRPDGAELDVLSRTFNRKEFSDESSWVDANAVVLKRSALRYFSRLPRTKTTFPKEDWEFVWRVSRKARVVHLPRVTVEYLVNADSYYTTWI